MFVIQNRKKKKNKIFSVGPILEPLPTWKLFIVHHVNIAFVIHSEIIKYII